MAVKEKAKNYSSAVLGAVLALQSGQAKDREYARQRDEAAEVVPETKSVLDAGARNSRSYTEPKDVDAEEDGEEGKNYPVDQHAESKAQRNREATMRNTQESLTGTQAFPLDEPRPHNEDRSGRRAGSPGSQEAEEPTPESPEQDQNPEVLQAEAIREAQARDANQRTAIQDADAEEQQNAIDSIKQQKKQMKNFWEIADLASSEGFFPLLHFIVQLNKDVFSHYLLGRKDTDVEVTIGRLFLTLWMDLALLLAPIFQLAVFLIPLTPIIAVAATVAWLAGIFN